MPLPSAYDNFFFPQSRLFIEDQLAQSLSLLPENSLVLDIGDQGKKFPRPFPESAEIKTLDIDGSRNANYVCDICDNNSALIQDGTFDAILLIEVLEHVCQPFSAVEEVERMLAPGGLLFFSSPLNCRIHGPVPDCWRFTEFGLQVLFRNFDNVVFEKFESPDRNLFPLQYFGVWRKPETPKNVPIKSLNFERLA
jgi:hypothetical protein